MTLVDELTARHGPAFRKKVTDEGGLRASCWLLVNGRRIEGSCLAELVRAGDEVVLTTPMLVGG